MLDLVVDDLFSSIDPRREFGIILDIVVICLVAYAKFFGNLAVGISEAGAILGDLREGFGIVFFFAALDVYVPLPADYKNV